jgi:hypothetical protein
MMVELSKIVSGITLCLSPDLEEKEPMVLLGA